MEKEYFYEYIQKNSRNLNIMFNVEQMEKFFKYMNLLIDWNEKINLTAITEPKEIIIKHFIDSVTISKYLNNNDKIIDIGTGAGFPGIPIKIVDDTLNITLLDSLNKRINFLNEVLKKLELNNIVAIHSRVEDFGRSIKNKEMYDKAVSRAVARLNVLAEYMLPLLKVGGQCICMKGPDIDEEVGQSEKAINILGGKIKEVEKFTLPNTDMGRSIVIIEKIKVTPNKYPRKAGIPSKEPLS